MTNWIYRTIIVPDSMVQYARDLSATVAGPSGSGMYTTALANKDKPAVTTHWISAGLISEEFAQLLPCKTVIDGEEVTLPGDATMVAKLANDNEFETTELQVKQLFESSYVFDADSFSCIQTLDLVIKQEESDLAN